MRLYSIIISGGLRGRLANDEGAYFGSSFGLINGQLPYKDFLLLHPPGSALIYAPAAATSWLVGEANSFAAARLFVVALGAISLLLIYRIAGRLGKTAAITAGVMYAVWFPLVVTERTTLLEPLVNLAMLGALAALDPASLKAPSASRRLLVAGALIGVGVTVKLYAGLPLIVIGGWLLIAFGWRKACVFLAGAAAAIAIVLTPFFIAAPDSMWRMIITDQLGRRHNETLSHLDRLSSMLYLRDVAAPPYPQVGYLWLLIAAAGAVVAWKTASARVWVALLAVNVAFLLYTPTFFINYSAFAAVPLILVAAAAAQLVATRLAAADASAIRTASIAVLIVGGLAVLAVFASPIRGRIGQPFPVGPATAAVAAGDCVTSDSATPIILTGRFASNVDSGCPTVVDLTGLIYEDHDGFQNRRKNTKFQETALAYLQQGDYVIISRSKIAGFRKTTIAELAKRPVVLKAPNLTIYGPLPR